MLKNHLKKKTLNSPTLLLYVSERFTFLNRSTLYVVGACCLAAREKNVIYCTLTKKQEVLAECLVKFVANDRVSGTRCLAAREKKQRERLLII